MHVTTLDHDTQWYIYPYLENLQGFITFFFIIYPILWKFSTSGLTSAAFWYGVQASHPCKFQKEWTKRCQGVRVAACSFHALGSHSYQDAPAHGWRWEVCGCWLKGIESLCLDEAGCSPLVKLKPGVLSVRWPHALNPGWDEPLSWWWARWGFLCVCLCCHLSCCLYSKLLRSSCKRWMSFLLSAPVWIGAISWHTLVYSCFSFNESS